jgi:hypothetical protein
MAHQHRAPTPPAVSIIGGDDDKPVVELILGQRSPIRLAKNRVQFRIRTTMRAARVLLGVGLPDPDMPTTDTHANGGLPVSHTHDRRERSCREPTGQRLGEPAVYLPVPHLDRTRLHQGADNVLEHCQHSIRPCKVMSLLAVQSSAVHVRVQQSPRGAPVTDGDHCVGSVTNVISSAIMMCPPCSGRAPKSWVLCPVIPSGVQEGRGRSPRRAPTRFITGAISQP